MKTLHPTCQSMRRSAPLISMLTESTSTTPEKEDVAIKVRLEIILDNLNYCSFHYLSEINVERK
jgi:hypothetical protein